MGLETIFEAEEDTFFYNEGRDNQYYVIPKGATLIYNSGGDNQYHILREGEVLAYAEGHDNMYHPMPKKLAIKLGFRIQHRIINATAK